MRRYFALGVAAMAMWFAAAPPALADPTRDAVKDAVARCEGIPDNRVWLDCFYGSAQPMRAALGLSSAPESQTRLVPAPGAAYGGAPAPGHAPVVKEKSESFFGALLGNTKPIASNMPMTAYGFARGGNFTVTMPDGHVWQQAESDIQRAKWNKPAETYRVTINYGSGPGLFDMRVNGVIYKVTRVK